MKANVESRTGNQVTMMVEIEAPELNKALDKAYQKLVKTVNIRGFRKGRVPRTVLEHYLGKGALLSEALEDMFPSIYSSAVSETGIKPVDTPNVEIQDLTEGGPVKLKVEVTVEPEVLLGEYKGLAVEKTVMLIDEKTVDQTLEQLREQQAQLVEPERDTVQQGDLVTIDYTGYVDGQAFPNGAATDVELEIGSGRFIPGFEEALVGAPQGDEIEINVTFPADYGSTELAGKDAVFKVTVHEIKEKVYPELNDEFAKDVSSCDTLADLRAEIRGNLEKQAQETAEDNLRNDLINLAVRNATIDVPEAMIKTEMDELTRDFEQRLAYQGLKLDVYLQAYNISREQFDGDVRAQAEQRVRTSLVLNAIAEKEGITVTSEEVDERIEQIAAGAGERADQVRSAYGRDSMRRGLEENLRLEKVVNLLADSALITVKETDAASEAEHEENAE
ncbi:MAG TPA: trigger factor [Firmicutes bacterium]|jgi:trigger factor|nr:trigger factor [Bacillota bacterium]